MSKISGPIAAIIISIIITLGALVGSGAFSPEPANYATINFDGGYKRIGVIYQERVYADATVEMNGRVIKSGSFADVVNFLKEAADEEGGGSGLNLKDGVAVRAKSGVQYLASESSFRLNMENLDVKSTQVNPVNQKELIKKLEDIEASVKQRRAEVSNNAISYSTAPEANFILPKIFSLIDRWASSQGLTDTELR